jgi:hypothetical protein
MQFGNGQDLKNILLGHLDVREGNVHFYFIYFSKSVHTHYTHNLTFNYEEVEMRNRIDDIPLIALTAHTHIRVV